MEPTTILGMTGFAAAAAALFAPWIALLLIRLFTKGEFFKNLTNGRSLSFYQLLQFYFLHADHTRCQRLDIPVDEGYDEAAYVDLRELFVRLAEPDRIEMARRGAYVRLVLQMFSFAGTFLSITALTFLGFFILSDEAPWWYTISHIVLTIAYLGLLLRVVSAAQWEYDVLPELVPVQDGPRGEANRWVWLVQWERMILVGIAQLFRVHCGFRRSVPPLHTLLTAWQIQAWIITIAYSVSNTLVQWSLEMHGAC